MHLLQHFLGLDNANGFFYLFWSGIGGSNIFIFWQIWKYHKTSKERQARLHAELHNHIQQQFTKLSEKLDQ